MVRTLPNYDYEVREAVLIIDLIGSCEATFSQMSGCLTADVQGCSARGISARQFIKTVEI